MAQDRFAGVDCDLSEAEVGVAMIVVYVFAAIGAFTVLVIGCMVAAVLLDAREIRRNL
jgi:hypothetical protein